MNDQLTQRLDAIAADHERKDAEIPKLIQPERSFLRDHADAKFLLHSLRVALKALSYIAETYPPETNCADTASIALTTIAQAADGGEG